MDGDYYVVPAKHPSFDVYFVHPVLGELHAGTYSGYNAQKKAQTYADNLNRRARERTDSQEKKELN